MKFFLTFIYLVLQVSVLQAQLPFNFLVMKLKVRLNDQSAQAQIRLQKDSLVWISLRKAGIEGIRMLASTDSVVILDPIHREAYIRTYTQIDSLLPGIKDIKSLQSILLGDILKPENLPSSIELTVENKNEEKMRNLQVSDKATKSFLSINYTKYKKIKGYEVPKKLVAKLLFFDKEAKNIDCSFYARKISATESKPDFYIKISKKYSLK